MFFRWSDFKMRTKLLTLASIGIVGLAVIGVMSTLNLKHSNNDLRHLNSSIQDVTRLGEMKSKLLSARLDVVYMMALEDMTKLNEKRADFSKQIEAIRTLQNEVDKSGLDQERKGLLASFKEGSEAYATQGTKLAE